MLIESRNVPRTAHLEMLHWLPNQVFGLLLYKEAIIYEQYIYIHIGGHLWSKNRGQGHFVQSKSMLCYSLKTFNHCNHQYVPLYTMPCNAKSIFNNAHSKNNHISHNITHHCLRQLTCSQHNYYSQCICIVPCMVSWLSYMSKCSLSKCILSKCFYNSHPYTCTLVKALNYTIFCTAH